MSAGELMKKLAADLRKLAETSEKTKMQKCAQITLGAAALEMLARKIRGN
jgi:hypothetical protein